MCTYVFFSTVSLSCTRLLIWRGRVHAFSHRSSSAPERPPDIVEPPKPSKEYAPNVLSPHQAEDATATLAEGESLSLDTKHDYSATATDSYGVSHEVVALHELIATQREDLKTAALIGQQLLDATDELSAKLEVSIGCWLL